MPLRPSCLRSGFLALLAASALPASPAAAPAASPVVRAFEGQAASLKGGAEILYTERYRDTLREGKLYRTGTHYVDAAGRPIADRALDFSKHAWKPDYRLVDRRDGYEEGAEVEGAKIRVFHRARRGKPLREKMLTVPEPAVIDGGFNRFIKDHWKSLFEGARVPFHFVAPSQLNYFAFEALRTDSGEGRVTFTIRPGNKVVRVLVDPIHVTYDVATRRMTGYRGLSNINDAHGKSLNVRLTYPELGP